METCPCCAFKVSSVCCSLCTSEHPLFALLPPSNAPLPKSTTPCASQVTSNYDMNEVDLSFRKALHAFRHELTVKEYSQTYPDSMSYAAIMGDKIFKHLMDCAWVNKIWTLKDIYWETKWNGTYEFGDGVLSLVNQYIPILPFSIYSTLIVSDTIRLVFHTPHLSAHPVVASQRHWALELPPEQLLECAPLAASRDISVCEWNTPCLLAGMLIALNV